MKKILVFVAFIAFSLTSCGDKTVNETTTTVDTVAVDSVAVDTVAVEATSVIEVK